MVEPSVLARGDDFTLSRVPFGHVAVVGAMRDGLDVGLAMANVDLVTTRSPCLVVDCSASDADAQALVPTILDWVLERASLEVEAEVWLLPTREVASERFERFADRVARRGSVVTYGESEAVAAVLRVLEERGQAVAPTDVVESLERARASAARPSSLGSYASPVQRSDELLLRSAMGEISESIMVTDTDLDEPGPRILYVNKAFSELTGYSESEVLGMSPRVLQGPRSDRAVLRRLRQTLERGEPFEGETVNYRRDGSEFAMHWSVHPLRDDAGEVVRYFAVQRDVTEQRRYEAIARAVNMTDNIGMIFSGIRHELGNPVNSIKTALSVLRRQHRSFGPDKTDTYLTLIMDEVSRVEFLLSSLRSYTAFERARSQDVDIAAFLRDFERLVRADLESHAIIFGIEAESELAKVRVDPRALNQVLLNLVRNSCDALVDMDDRRVDIVADSAGSRVRLVVRDNGCGMSQAHLDRLFLPFHTTKERGTGLGLVIAQKLVTEMGGHLHVKSERRKGTEVTVELSRGGGFAC